MRLGHGVVLLGMGLGSGQVMADFVGDTKAGLEVRNFYFSRDFRNPEATQSKREEWAQGFVLKVQSGYTEGTVGFGLDALGLLGLKLDSSADRAGTGLLPRNTDRRAVDDFSTFAPTAKVRLGNSELRIGALTPTLPLLAANYSRLLPQVFNGGLLTSTDIDNLTLTLGRIDQVKYRDSSDFEDLAISSMSGGFSSAARSDGMDYAGADYKLDAVTLSYHSARLDDIYRRDYAGVQFSQLLGDGKLFGEVRYFVARDEGRALAGEVDNRTVSSNVGYKIGGHGFSGGYQKGSGDTAFAYLNGSDTYLFSEMLVSTFALQNERVWHLRYDYDFAALGVPGLTFNLRYVKGDEVDPEHIRTSRGAALRAGGEDGKEWERATDLTYTVQGGPLKNLSLRWRNATNRSNYADSADENRVILSYQIKFL
ncbi:Porin-like protein NicP precursor [Pseudomonas putida]|uniref:Porin-like protein NicP n=2 Tax=Pseudomonas putida TaxID=303 RepID=A0A1Q9R1S6_PSEPU|nr:Porin-like protein NicP precursor [Pseudomonas putida]